MSRGMIVAGFSAIGKNKYDSEKVLEERCYARGNNKIFTDKLKINLHNWNEIIKKYHPKKLLIIQKDECFEDVLKKKELFNK